MIKKKQLIMALLCMFMGLTSMQEDKISVIHLKVGASTEIKLPGLATAGYEWQYKADKISLIRVKHRYKAPVNNPKKPLAGAAGEEIFTITALHKGKVKIIFTQVRPWEKNTPPVATKTILVAIP